MATTSKIERVENCSILRMQSPDGTNRLDKSLVRTMTAEIRHLGNQQGQTALVITGSEGFFSAGADLREITSLDGPTALEFSKIGQMLMNEIAEFPSPTYAAISGYCMGGGLDLALACRYRIAAPEAVFGHRGASLGLLTGWGGTQRLPRLVGKGRALELFVTAEKINAARALEIGLIDAIADDPVHESLRRANVEIDSRRRVARFRPAGIP